MFHVKHFSEAAESLFHVKRSFPINPQPPRLGKGLSAIVGPAAKPAPANDGPSREIPLSAIRPNPNQPRREFDETALSELSNSIRINGVLQPVLVRPLPDGQFELVAGERRWRASQRAGKTSIPAIVRELTDQQSLEIALIENLQRQDLGTLERAEGYQRYLDLFGGSVEQLAVRLGESRPNLVNYLRLLKLPNEVRHLLTNGEIGMGHARAIAGVADAQRQVAIARLAIRRNLSVRQVETMCREVPAAPSGNRDGLPTGSVRHMEHVAEQLSRAIGMPVQVITGKRKNSGRVIITYNSIEDFDRLARAFGADTLVG